MAVTSKTATYEEWLRMPEVEDAREKVADEDMRTTCSRQDPGGKLRTAAILSEGQTSARTFPGASIEIAATWPE